MISGGGTVIRVFPSGGKLKQNMGIRPPLRSDSPRLYIDKAGINKDVRHKAPKFVTILAISSPKNSNNGQICALDIMQERCKKRI